VADLAEYRRKRDFKKTTEPSGSAEGAGDREFVVQKHAATRLHYDLRLELDGVLKSWAVPKGPSMNPADKRLAVQVEDHPFDYRTFEGSIPKGEYGGGEVIVWDKGTYAPEGALSTKEQLARGELKFRLEGEKLRGSFVLVRTRRNQGKPEWLLIKHRDAFADPEWNPDAHPESVMTGRTLEDIANGVPARKLRPRRSAMSEAIPGAVKAPMPEKVSVTLAKLGERPFSDPEWLFEIKWDGVRTLAYVRHGKTKLESRSGRDVTLEYPEFAGLAKHLSASEAILDGEIVSLDDAGRSSFQKLQNRLSVQKPSLKLMQSVPVTCYFFDLIYWNGMDLRKTPLWKRKELLQHILRVDERIRYSAHEVERGEALYEAARENGLEGILAKQVSSSYSGARTAAWIKLKIVKELDAVVAGWTAPRGSRKYFGALVLGLYEGKDLRFIGSVGTGFDEPLQERIFNKLERLKTARAPFQTIPDLKEKATWVMPELVARVRYANWTEDTHLRVPVFLGLRDDRKAQDCTFASEKPGAGPSPASSAPAPESPRLPSDAPSKAQRRFVRSSPAPDSGDELRHGKAETLDLEVDGRKLHLTHLNKMYFPAVGLRKRDLLAYYYRMARYMIPFLEDRPIVLRRYPDGVGGKAFFQKEAPSFLPDWIRTATVYSDERGGDMQYILANDRPTLLYLTNLGCIDHNPWSSRAGSQDSPDYVFFDLDPTPGTPYSAVLRVARTIHQILEEIRLKSFLKTSGASGFHIFVPLQPGYSYEQTRTFAEIVGKIAAADLPELTTFERTVSKRPKGRVLIDALQNARGKPLATVYSARAEEHAGVSTPLQPKELDQNIEPKSWTVSNIERRLAEVGDLWSGFWQARQALDTALDRLDSKLRGNAPAKGRAEVVPPLVEIGKRK